MEEQSLFDDLTQEEIDERSAMQSEDVGVDEVLTEDADVGMDEIEPENVPPPLPPGADGKEPVQKESKLQPDSTERESDRNRLHELADDQHLMEIISQMGGQLASLQRYVVAMSQMMGFGNLPAIGAGIEIPQANEIINYSLDPETLSQFVIEIPIGGKDTPMLSAEGFQHILQAMRLAVTESEVTTDPDDPDYWTAWAKVKNPTGGIQKGISRQAKKYQNGNVDKGAYMAVHTKAIRNGIKATIPVKTLQAAAIAFAKNKVANKDTPIAQAQERVKLAVEYYRQNWKGTLAVDDNRLWKLVVERHGKMDEWEITVFDEVAHAYRHPRESWFADAIEFAA